MDASEKRVTEGVFSSLVMNMYISGIPIGGYGVRGAVSLSQLLNEYVSGVGFISMRGSYTRPIIERHIFVLEIRVLFESKELFYEGDLFPSQHVVGVERETPCYTRLIPKNSVVEEFVGLFLYSLFGESVVTRGKSIVAYEPDIVSVDGTYKVMYPGLPTVCSLYCSELQIHERHYRPEGYSFGVNNVETPRVLKWREKVG